MKWHYEKGFAEQVMKKAKPIYRDLLNRMYDIGADNPMASNVYTSFVFIAVWKAAEGKITVKALREISKEVMQFKPLKLAGLFINANQKKGIESIKNTMLKNAQWLEEHPQYQKYSWDFNFDESKHKDGYYYHFTQCPLNTFARREGLLDVLQVMCDVDYLSAGLMHAKLYRKHTLASGGKICDYWFVGDKIENPE